MNDLAIPFAESLLDTLEGKFAYVEWGTPNHIGHCYVYWDSNAGTDLEEDEDLNRVVRVPQPRWLAGKCKESVYQGKPAKFTEERFESLREALEWLTGPSPDKYADIHTPDCAIRKSGKCDCSIPLYSCGNGCAHPTQTEANGCRERGRP